MTNEIKVYKTRFPELGFIHQARNLWRFVDMSASDPAFCTIGPQYASKGELLGDLTRYATNYGLQA